MLIGTTQFLISNELLVQNVDPLFLFCSEKAEEGPYWERLLADKSKQHWLKVSNSFKTKDC
jgi:hypothetical protein